MWFSLLTATQTSCRTSAWEKLTAVWKLLHPIDPIGQSSLDKQTTLFFFRLPKLYHGIVRSIESAVPDSLYLSSFLSHSILYKGLILEDFMQDVPLTFFPLWTRFNYEKTPCKSIVRFCSRKMFFSAEFFRMIPFSKN